MPQLVVQLVCKYCTSQQNKHQCNYNDYHRLGQKTMNDKKQILPTKTVNASK